MTTAFSRPALQDLINQSVGYVGSRLPALTPALRRNLYSTLATANAMLANTGFGYLDWIVLNALIPYTAIGDYLDRWANFFNLPRNGPSTSVGSVIFTASAGAAGAGLPVPAGTVVQTADSTQTYLTQALATLDGSGSATVAVASANTGSATQLAAGTVLNLAIAIAGLNGTVTVASGGITGGVDTETDAALQIRLRARMASPPQGGSASDYIAWIKEFYPAATRAWCYPLGRGVGTVDVTFVMDGQASAGGDAAILPGGGDLAAVNAALAIVRPVTADVRAFALVNDPQALRVLNLVPNTTAIQDAIATALAAFYLTTTPGVGAGLIIVGDGVDEYHPAGLIALEQVSAAIQAVDGVVRFDLAAPVADVQSAGGHIGLFGSVVFV